MVRADGYMSKYCGQVISDSDMRLISVLVVTIIDVNTIVI